MLNAIIKKVTSTNVSKAKLQVIADILNIKTTTKTKMDDSKYLSEINLISREIHNRLFWRKQKLNSSQTILRPPRLGVR